MYQSPSTNNGVNVTVNLTANLKTPAGRETWIAGSRPGMTVFIG